MHTELTPKHVADNLSEHEEFFQSKQTRSINFRLAQLDKLKQAIIEFEPKITEALRKDLGKHPFESYTTEIGYVLNSITHTKKRLRKWAKPKRVKTPVSLFPSKSMIRYEPYGTILIIGPFNYPFQLLIEPLIGAIAAGNCAVIKPSELVPNVADVIADLIETVFDPSYIRCVQGGVETNTSLINAPFDYIFFTGSVSVGKIVMEAAAKNLIPVTLELGGKSPVIVDESADIKAAAQRIVWGKVLNAGQTCVAPDYLMVHQAVKEELIEEMKQVLQAFFLTSTEESKDYGRIVNQRHFERLSSMLERDQEQIIYGGSTNPDTRYIEPTLVEATWESASMEDEIFGPILPILPYGKLDEAIQSMNKLSKPLALYLFTSNPRVEEKVLTEIPSGGVSINNTITHLANPELPFGGIGHSGMGAYHGHYSFTTFSHERSVLKTSTKFNMALLFPPYDEKKLNLIRRFLK